MGKNKNEKIVVGQCPICERDMIQGSTINEHHFTPKCCGGKEKEFLHKICHNKIHKVWPNEKDLAREYNTPEKIRSHPEMQKFIKWVKKKDPEYYDNSDKQKGKKKKR